MLEIARKCLKCQRSGKNRQFLGICGIALQELDLQEHTSGKCHFFNMDHFWSVTETAQKS